MPWPTQYTDYLPPVGTSYTTRTGRGYVYLRWSDSLTRICYCALEHRCVWTAHHGSIPSGHVIHHRDGNRSNNAVDNLECKPSGLHASDHLRKYVLPAGIPYGPIAKNQLCPDYRREIGRRYRSRLHQPGNEARLVDRTASVVECHRRQKAFLRQPGNEALLAEYHASRRDYKRRYRQRKGDGTHSTA
ncbi:MAG TPA: hypothetical protein DCS05_09285 [Nitrospiraceae bacterium]|nr:hypothetical protein [Nitrospiraceae bacterium]